MWNEQTPSELKSHTYKERERQSSLHGCAIQTQNQYIIIVCKVNDAAAVLLRCYAVCCYITRYN
jgi:hypothetical protein